MFYISLPLDFNFRSYRQIGSDVILNVYDVVGRENTYKQIGIFILSKLWRVLDTHCQENT